MPGFGAANKFVYLMIALLAWRVRDCLTGINRLVQGLDNPIQGIRDFKGSRLLGNEVRQRRQTARFRQFGPGSITERFHGLAKVGEDIRDLLRVLDGQVAAKGRKDTLSVAPLAQVKRIVLRSS